MQTAEERPSAHAGLAFALQQLPQLPSAPLFSFILSQALLEVFRGDASTSTCC